MKEIIAEKADCEISAIKENSHIELDLGLDSIDHMELVYDLEKEFDICIPYEEGECAMRVKDFVDMVNNYILNR